MTSVFYLAVQEQTDTKKFDELVKIFPHAQLIKAPTYQEATLKAASRLMTTNYFFVVCDFHRVKHSITLVANPLVRAMGDDRMLNDRKDILSYPSQAWPATWDGLERDPPPTDIVFLSYDEPNAEENYRLLADRFGSRVKRVHGVKGIDLAHRAAAEIVARTDWFYVVDADNVIEPTFNFDFYPDDARYVHIWMARNGLVPELTYGYGGVKLMHKRHFVDAGFKGLDFSTKLAEGVHYHDEVASTTKFNSSAFTTWRATFREVTKLLRNKNDESLARLKLWKSLDPKQPFAYSALRGIELAETIGDMNDDQLHSIINDFRQLELMWKAL